MAKSIRAKTKMAARKKKREVGNYAAADAARVERLSAKLLGKSKAQEGDKAKVVEEGDEEEEEVEGEDATMDDAEVVEPKKISTSGSREPRREAWRASKGMEPRGKSAGMNRQGRMGARSKAGRPKRRR